MARTPIDPRQARRREVQARRASPAPIVRFDGGRWQLVRAMMKFQLKLAVDGLKDVLLAPLAVVAVMLDWKRAKAGEEWESFERVMGLGEKFERWLALYGTPGRASIDPDDPDDLRRGGILDEGGSDVLLDTIERKARGLRRGTLGRDGDEDGDAPRGR